MSDASPLVRLIDAAEAVIAEEGWSAATTRRVAERAGLAQGLVHYHAHSIEALRREATLRAIRRFFDQPLAADDSTAVGSRAWLLRLLSPGHPSTAHDRELRILHESLPAAARDPELRSEIATHLGRYRDRIATALRERGCSADAASALAATITAAVDGAVLQKSLDPDLDLAPLAEVLAASVRAVGCIEGEDEDAPAAPS